MSIGRSLVLVGTCAVIGGCAAHEARHTAPDESQPHITWEIRTGGPEGEARQVCESAQPQPDCTLPASVANRREFVTIHFYLHSLKEVARYDGTLRIPFIGRTSTERQVSTTVQPGTSAENLTIVGDVTPKPGKYTMSIALKTKHGTKDSVPINQDIAVVVR